MKLTHECIYTAEFEFVGIVGIVGIGESASPNQLND